MNTIFLRPLIFLSVISLLFITFIPFCLAQSQPQVPTDMSEVKSIFGKVLETIPNALKSTYGVLKGIYVYIHPYFKIAWDKAYYYLGKEVERRKPSVQQEFNKEVSELKNEAVKEAPSLWQHFLDLIH